MHCRRLAISHSITIHTSWNFTFLYDLLAHRMWPQAVWLTSDVRYRPLCYYWVYEFVKIGHMVQKFKSYRQTHNDKRVIWRCWNPHCLCFLSQKANHYAAYITVLSATTVTMYDDILLRPTKHRMFQFPNFSKNNMADKRICEAVTTQARQILTGCGHLLLLFIYFKRCLTSAWYWLLIHKRWICYITTRDIAADIYIGVCVTWPTWTKVYISYGQLQQITQPHCKIWLRATKLPKFIGLSVAYQHGIKKK